MIEKTINHKDIGLTVYPIYEKEEADELGIEYVDWWDTEPGDFGLTDDGLVLQLIKKKVYQGHGKEINTLYTFPLGSVFRSNKYPGKRFNIREIRGTYLTSNETRDEKRLKSSKGRQMAMMYALIPNPSFVIDSVLGPHSQTSHGKWTRHFKTEVFKKMVREEMSAMLKDKGLDEGATLDLLNSTIEMCKTKKDTSTLMRAVSELFELHGMKNKDKIRTTDTIEATQRQLIEQVGATDNTLKLSREVVKNVRDADEGDTE